MHRRVESRLLDAEATYRNKGKERKSKGLISMCADRFGHTKCPSGCPSGCPSDAYPHVSGDEIIFPPRPVGLEPDEEPNDDYPEGDYPDSEPYSRQDDTDGGEFESNSERSESSE